MSNQLFFKKSSVPSKVPLTTDLEYGELAINYADGKLYFKNSSNVIKSFITFDDVAAADYVTRTTTQTITGNKTFSNLSVDALTATNQIQSTVATGTAPFNIASTTLNTNLNADLLDGQHGSYYQQSLTSGTNIKTINGNSILGAGNLSVSGGISYIKKTSAYTAVDRDGILADTSGGSFTINLPASATVGMQVWIADDGSWATNNLIVDPNGGTIEGLAVDENLVLDLSGVQVQFIHNGTKWQIYVTYGSGDGGYVTLSGTQILTNKTLTDPAINWTTATNSGNALASLFRTSTIVLSNANNGATLQAGMIYSAWTGAAAFSLNLPSYASTNTGDVIRIYNLALGWATNNLTIVCPATSTIMNLTENLVCDTNVGGIALTCVLKNVNYAYWQVTEA